MNYMAEVAKILGVELGEEFKINVLLGTYVFTHDGLHEADYGADCSIVLTKLLSGEYVVRRKPWKPKDNEVYYRINDIGNVTIDTWDGLDLDIIFYKLGNCYRTRDEAEANHDKWVSFYASDEVLEV